MTSITASLKITALLEKLGLNELEFPSYLKELLAYNGYDNVHSISMITDDDVAKMEQFAREDLPDLLEPAQKRIFYGIYEKNVGRFKILQGHLKLLQIMIKKCKVLVASTNNNDDMEANGVGSRPSSEHQTRKRKPKTNFKADSKNTSDLPLTEQEKIKAIEHIKNVVINYATKFLNTLDEDDKRKQIGISKLQTVSVDLDNEIGRVKCPQCDFISKNCMQTENGKRKWVLSNFNKHFKTHFKKRLLDKPSDNVSKKLKNSSIVNYLQIPTIAQPSSSNSDSRSEVDDGTNLMIYPVFNSERFIISDPDTGGETDSNISENFREGRITTEENLMGRNSASETPQSQELKSQPSRAERQKKKRSTYFDKTQTMITEFYKVCDMIKEQIPQIPLLLDQLQSNMSIVNDEKPLTIHSSLGFFEMLQETSSKNCSASATSSETSKHGFRYSEELKKLSLYIFLTAGRLAYDTLVANMRNSLPSRSTLYRTFGTFAKTVEGEIKFADLRMFLQKRKYPLKVIISEDQTGIVKRVRYNPTNNEMVGFVCRTSEETGFPLPGQHQIYSVNDIKDTYENEIISNNAYVFMAQPLVDQAPAFCLSIFGSDNRFRADDVLKRWDYLETESKKYGISIEGFSSDGDTRCLKSMKMKFGLPTQQNNSPYAPYFQAIYSLDSPVVVQDTIHISTKIKTRILKDSELPIGNYIVKRQHLEKVMEWPKTQHFLCKSYLEATDKMNFEAINKMSAPCVSKILEQIEDARATRRILIITRYILDAFLDKSINVVSRVYFMWYSTFFLRLWRSWVKKHEIYTLSKNWLSLNAYTCVEMNAHSLLIIIEKCRRDKSPESLLPWLPAL